MLSAPRILYFEDHLDEIAQFLPKICDQFHASVDLAKNFQQANEFLQTNRYDLFLLDIEIDGTRATGIQFAEQLRKDPRYIATPIIFTSMHTHHSHRSLSNLRHIAFLSKPFTQDQLLMQIGVALESPEYLKYYYQPPYLQLPVSNRAIVEIDPTEISFIQFADNQLTFQYINGEQLFISRRIYSFQEILQQIEELHIDFLRQIYRSIIVNIKQIQNVQLGKNIASVFLFHDETPKPLAYRYRHNLAEYLKEGAYSG